MQMPQMAKDVIIKGVIALRPAAVKPHFSRGQAHFSKRVPVSFY
jgi:hypothetical protein